MKNVLRYLSLWLLIMAAIPMQALELDEVTILDTNLTGFTGFSGNSIPSGGGFETMPREVWTYSNEYGCWVAENPDATMMEANLNFGTVDLSDEHYSDARCTIELQPIDLNRTIKIYRYITAGQFWNNDSVIGTVTPDDNGKTITIANVDISRCINQSPSSFHILLKELPVNFGKLLVKRVLITVKHPYKKKTPVELTNLGGLKDLANDTYVHLSLSRLDIAMSFDGQNFLHDNTGYACMRFNWKKAMHANNSFYDVDIKAIYSKASGIPKLLYDEVEYDYDNQGWYETRYKSITEEEYLSNAGNVVSILSDDAWLLTSAKDSIHISGNKALIRGIAYPVDNRIRICSTAYDALGYVVADDGTNDYDSKPNGYNYYATDRHFVANQWHTLMSAGYFIGMGDYNAEFAVLDSAEDGEIKFKTVTSKPSTPCLVKFSKDVYGLMEGYSKPTEMQVTSEGTDYDFIGTYEPITPTGQCYYLSANNTIRPLASGGTIKGFRAFFKKKTSSAAPARAISIDGVVTSVNDVEIDGLFPDNSNAPVYNLNGQRVNDSSKKGLYIQNGKKIIR